MPIVKSRPDNDQVVTYDTLPSTIPEIPKSTFTNIIPEEKIKSLLKYVEGYPWTVCYYGQVLNENNTVEHFDPTVPNLLQSYYKISNLILQVDAPISSNYDTSTGVTIVSGSAITPYTLKPNTGDIFLANIDTGEDAIFIINSVSRKTHRKDTLYEITYNLYAYTSVNSDLIPTIETRVQDAYFFNKDTDFFNRDVLITTQTKEAIDNLKNYKREILDYYFSVFSQRETGGILVPNKDFAIYDNLVVDFISKIADYKVMVDKPFYRYSYGLHRYLDQKSIYDMLLTRNISMSAIINKRFGFASSGSLDNLGRLGTIGVSNADYILYPIITNRQNKVSTITGDPIELIDTATMKDDNYFLFNGYIVTVNGNKNVLHDIFKDNYYVVTEDFYLYLAGDNSKASSISFIEFLLAKYIRREAITKTDLAIAIESYKNWSMLHQFYLLPILLLLINVTI